MSSTAPTGGRRGRGIAAAATVVLLVVGIVALVFGVRGQDGPPQPDSAAAPVTTSASTAPSSSPRTTAASPSTTTPAPTTTAAAPSTPDPRFGSFLPASAPVGLEIPAIGVDSTTFVDLTVSGDGTITVPGSADEVGFYAGGPTPGQLGPAVIGAHVDSTKGPGVFYRLGAVKPGNKVIVHRQDGTTLSFTVDKVANYPKDQFPTDEVYRGSDFTKAEIRLVTCGGPFDKVKHYLDNTIVFGHLDPPA